MGLVSRVLPDEELSSAALAIASELAGRSAEALAAIKHLMRANAIGTFDTALDAECDAQAILGRTQAYRDAVLRFARARK